jgi:hypothetical protein
VNARCANCSGETSVTTSASSGSAQALWVTNPPSIQTIGSSNQREQPHVYVECVANQYPPRRRAGTIGAWSTNAVRISFGVALWVHGAACRTLLRSPVARSYVRSPSTHSWLFRSFLLFNMVNKLQTTRELLMVVCCTPRLGKAVVVNMRHIYVPSPNGPSNLTRLHISRSTTEGSGVVGSQGCDVR